MSLRFVGRKIVGSILTLLVVLVFNFFLFRIVKSDPVGVLFRGQKLPPEVKLRLRHQFGLDKSKWRPVLALHAPDAERQPRLVVPDRSSGHRGDRRRRSGRRSGSSVCRPSSRPSSACCSGIKSAWQRNSLVRPAVDRHLDVHLRDPRLLPRHPVARGVRVRAEPAADRRHREPRRDGRRLQPSLRPVPAPALTRGDADDRLHGRVRDRDALVAAGGDG